MAFAVHNNIGLRSVDTRIQRSPCAARLCVRRVPSASLIAPSSYEEMYTRAARASDAALRDGVRAVEVEFPATPSLSRAGDGSLAAERAERQSNARLAAAVARSLSPNVVVVTFDKRMMKALESISVSAISASNLSTTKSTNTIVAAMPAVEEDWALLESLARNQGRQVVVCNGVSYNGMEWLEPVFHLKPCTGYGKMTGILLREYPHPYRVLSARTDNVLEMDVAILQEGRRKRPDFQSVSSALMEDWAKSS